MHALRRAISYLGPYWLIAVGAVASLILVTAANLVIPQIIRWVIDGGITAGHMRTIIWGALGLVLVAVVRGVFNFTQGFWSEKASQNVAFDVRNDLFDQIQSLLCSGFVDSSYRRHLLSNVTNLINSYRVLILGSTPHAILFSYDVFGCNDRLDTDQFFSAARIYMNDSGVGVGASQDLPV